MPELDRRIIVGIARTVTRRNIPTIVGWDGYKVWASQQDAGSTLVPGEQSIGGGGQDQPEAFWTSVVNFRIRYDKRVRLIANFDWLAIWADGFTYQVNEIREEDERRRFLTIVGTEWQVGNAPRIPIGDNLHG